jgi:hypothetical protein
VYFFETKLVRKAILIVPTRPAAKLSRPTIKDNKEISAWRFATMAKNKFVTRTLAPPIRRLEVKVSRLIN